MSKLLQQFRAARAAGTPLIVIQTADPAATMQAIRQNFNGAAPPILQWDTVCGIRPINEAGKQIVSGMTEPGALIGPVGALVALADVPANTLTFMHNMHRCISENGVSQAIWNLRDPYKNSQRTLVMMAPSIDLPIEIQQDVLVLDEPLPTDEQLGAIVADIYKSADMSAPEDLSKPVGAICGLAAFPAEQSCAMAMTKKGLNLDWLWARKCKTIEQQKGLSVWKGGERFSDIGGYENLKRFLTKILKGHRPPRGVLFLDELEKSIGTGHDTSGVSQDMLGQLLAWMNDTDSRGVLLIGPPGTSKSLFAKATGNEGDMLTIAFDIGGMKGSLVGDSEAAMRNALKVCDAVTQRQALVIGTCNSIESLPPELRRRFTLGIFFVDLPNAEERQRIWDIYLAKYKVTCRDFPCDEGWTGAEIKQAVQLCADLDITLEEAKDYIVPVSKSAAEKVSALRSSANGRYISASYSGFYDKDKGKEIATARRMTL